MMLGLDENFRTNLLISIHLRMLCFFNVDTDSR